MALCGWSVRPAGQVQAPLVRECFAHIECRLVELELAGQYNLCVLEPVALWVDEQREPEEICQVLPQSQLWLHGRDLASVRNQALGFATH